jgi:hydrogenase maturation protease
MRKDTVVIGLGNPLMGDEGVGPAILNRLSVLAGRFPSLEFVDAGTGGMSLLHTLSSRRKAILVDCCLMSTVPGTIKMFKPEDVCSVKRLSHYSLHDVDILSVIELARWTGDCPGEILIFGIEPAAIEPKESLSPELAERLDNYVSLVIEQLKR